MIPEEEINKLFTYHKPTETSQRRLEAIRFDAKVLAHTININCPDSPDKSAAIRLLREAVMTANAAIVLNQEPQI